jgi:FkbM family methyltransferase
MDKGVLFQIECPVMSADALCRKFGHHEGFNAGSAGITWLLADKTAKVNTSVSVKCTNELLQGLGDAVHVREVADLEHLSGIVPGSGIYQLLCASHDEIIERIQRRLHWFSSKVLADEGVYIFAAHRNAVKCIRYCEKIGITIAGLLDNDPAKHGKEICGINVTGIDGIPKDAIIVNASGRYCIEINEQLDRLGYEFHLDFMELLFIYDLPFQATGAFREYVTEVIRYRFKVLSMYLACKDDQSRALIDGLVLYRLTLQSDCLKGLISPYDQEFFAKDIISFGSDEVFVDGGAYDGDSFKKFKDMTRGFKAAYLFEPDLEICDKMHVAIGDEKGVFIINSGLWSTAGELKFSVTGDMDGAISDHGEVSISVVALDDHIDEKLSYIKLDIEGAEAEAMIGAKRHLGTDRPKLAIAVYHKACDFWELPALVEKFGGMYDFSFRHYSHTIDDTVLYATPI